MYIEKYKHIRLSPEIVLHGFDTSSSWHQTTTYAYRRPAKRKAVATYPNFQASFSTEFQGVLAANPYSRLFITLSGKQGPYSPRHG
jgi:hypothetical protein